MRNFIILSKYQTLLLLRNLKSTLIGFSLPILMFFIFSNLLGQYKVEESNLSIVEYLVPAYIPIIIINAVLIIFGQQYILYKEQGNLLKYKLLGLTSFTVAASIYLATIVFQLLTSVTLILFAFLLKGVVFPFDNTLSLLGGFFLINLFQFALTVFIVSIIHKSTTYQPVAFMLFYYQMFLGGLTFPPEMFPDFLRKLMYIFNPIIYGLEIMRGVWVDGKVLFSFIKETSLLISISVVLIIISILLNKKNKNTL